MSSSEVYIERVSINKDVCFVSGQHVNMFSSFPDQLTFVLRMLSISNPLNFFFDGNRS